ncbi:hypothetical protein M8523_28315, partial [Hyphomicrobiales bacterium BP6-180914]
MSEPNHLLARRLIDGDEARLGERRYGTALGAAVMNFKRRSSAHGRAALPIEPRQRDDDVLDGTG